MTENKPLSIKELIKKEYAKCAIDPIYFMQKYVYIQTSKGRSLFALYLFQEKLLSLFHKHDRILVLKSRQLGITTLCAGYALWLMLFKKDQSILCLAPDQDKAKAIITKLRFAFDELPSWLKSGCEEVEHNKTVLRLKNGSVAQAVSGASKSARSKTANFLILDEAAFIDNADELWGSAQQTLATGGKAIVLSTPNGAQGWFYDMWTEAEEGGNNFIPVRLPWDIHPERDAKWREDQEKELGKKMAAQECDCSFISSGDTYIEAEHLEYYANNVEDPIEVRGVTSNNKDFWIWKKPYEVGPCMVILDTSKGGDGDSSGLQVIEIASGDQVAEYKGPLEPKDLAKLGIQISIEYNNALLIIENTGLGEATTSHAKEYGYNNIYYSPKGDSTDVQKYMDKWAQNDPDKMQAGFPTSTKTRPLIIHAFRQYVIEHSIKIRSRRTVAEMRSFIWKNGKPQAKSSFHDDLLMPYAIGLYLRDGALEYQSMGVDMQKAVLNGFRKTSGLAIQTSSKPVRNPYEMNIGGQMEDISWVLGR